MEKKKSYLPKSLILFPYHSTEYDEDNSLNIGYENYLKDIIKKMQTENNKRSELEDKFNQEIEELSKETENLVSEIDKWQM